MVTKSTEEAMALLKKKRAQQIERAREIARELIKNEGKTHIRRVRAEMADEVDPDVPDYWLGAVFRHDDFEPTGEWYEEPNDTTTERARREDRNIHAWRPVRVWRFKNG